MKLIFLDIDGVLNRGFRPFQPDMVAQLNRVTEATGAQIVIHSSWRYMYALSIIQIKLSEAGVTGEIIDACPTPAHEVKMSGIILSGWGEFQEGAPSHDERAIAIWRWLQDNPEKDPGDAFVIFDDCHKLGHYVGTKHFIHTAISTGITQALADQAIQVLGEASS